MYITGGIGSTVDGEAFTIDYDLPNDTVYAETCASIGLVFFARKMLDNVMDGRYADVMERALYNGIISGMQLDGKRFFYVNPLENRTWSQRKNYMDISMFCRSVRVLVYMCMLSSQCSASADVSWQISVE